MSSGRHPGETTANSRPRLRARDLIPKMSRGARLPRAAAPPAVPYGCRNAGAGKARRRAGVAKPPRVPAPGFVVDSSPVRAQRAKRPLCPAAAPAPFPIPDERAAPPPHVLPDESVLSEIPQERRE